MQPVASDSLLNEAGFLAELATLDEGLTTKRRSSPAKAADEREYEPLPELSTPIRTTPPGMFASDPEPAGEEETESRPSVVGQAVGVLMFVLMMFVGAAGAALVFHNQVARILATW